MHTTILYSNSVLSWNQTDDVRCGGLARMSSAKNVIFVGHIWSSEAVTWERIHKTRIHKTREYGDILIIRMKPRYTEHNVNMVIMSNVEKTNGKRLTTIICHFVVRILDSTTTWW